MEAQLAATPPHLSDDICAEILVRLPVKSVLRFRVVCKAWRDITTRPLFLAANARRQPAKVVLYTYLDSVQRGYAVDIALDVLPVSGETADQRRLIRYPRSVPLSSMDPLLLDSCNGVLLFRKDAAGIYFLCNPVTRQWAELPKLTDESYGRRRRTVNVREYAFYFHQQSGEYRLLCGRLTSAGRTWCILSTGAAEPRHVDTHAADAGLEPDTPSETTPVALHDSMHWPPRRPRDLSSKQETTTEMVAFDVQSEKFRLMAGPRTITHPLMKLFVMHGLLVAANFGAAKHVDLWFLVDYGAGRWERRHQVPTPWQSISHYSSNLWSTAAACDDQGNIMLGSHCGLLVYNVRMKTIRAVHSVATPRNNVLVSRHVFRESLVEHPNFKRSSAADLPFIHFWC
ncbi:unnamed protein product [Miscanthus lutarioriparius]|uniref:F-box domain-containing protein n=1 Tax=Miscanthus lutarioriparius TaxID=422564 RepID=A0A811QNC6_9POAL|nr:unnamed protein product [Miscanthus lutarioriparius]